MTEQAPAEQAVIDASDLAQLFIVAAEEARPGRRFLLLQEELRQVLDEVGAERLPRNPRAIEPLVRVALALAHAAAHRPKAEPQPKAPAWWTEVEADVDAWKLEADAELKRWQR
jgi:hypothetical protein